MLDLIILILVIIVFFVALYRYIEDHRNFGNKALGRGIEGMNNSRFNTGANMASTQKQAFKGTFDGAFNGKMSISDQYFYDKLFDNVVYYPNEYVKDESMADLTLTGWDKCLQENGSNGNCIEFGVTGNAYFFAPIDS